MADATGALPAASLLQLIWLASPALPVGGFSYSEGLEAAIEWAGVGNEADAGEWLADQLHLSLARSDLAIVAQAIPAWRSGELARIRELNDWVFADPRIGRVPTADRADGPLLRRVAQAAARRRRRHLRRRCPPATRRLCLRRQPHRGARCATPAWPSPSAGPRTWRPAAVKAVPLGQSAGQRILGRWPTKSPPAVDRALALADDERQAFSPMLAVLSARHETQYSRLFRS